MLFIKIYKEKYNETKKEYKAALIIKLKDSLITVLRNTLSSILLTVKETIVKT